MIDENDHFFSYKVTQTWLNSYGFVHFYKVLSLLHTYIYNKIEKSG